MRPPAIEKMGFYETSIKVAQLLKTYFKPAETVDYSILVLAKVLRLLSWLKL